MRVFVVSLPRAAVRREHMRQELGKHNIKFSFFDALNGEQAKKCISDSSLSYLPEIFSPGELGCALSHISLWQQLVRSQDEVMVILEDDVFLGRDAARFLQNDDWIPRPIFNQLVKLEKFQNEILIGKAKRQVGGRWLHPLLGDHWGTGGYLIGRSAAQKMLAYLAGHTLSRQIDHFMYDTYRQLEPKTVWQLNPAICIQEVVHQQKNGLGSGLDAEREERKVKEVLAKPEMKNFWQKQGRIFKTSYWRYKFKKAIFLKKISFI